MFEQAVAQLDCHQQLEIIEAAKAFVAQNDNARWLLGVASNLEQNQV